MSIRLHTSTKRRPMIEADRLFNRPWFISGNALQSLVVRFQAGPNAWGQGDDEDGEPLREYPMTDDGIACIPITGPLTKGYYWRGTAYGEIQEWTAAAVADPACKAILFCYDSPGGEASGMFDLADYLYSIRGTKPIAAISDDQCYSAAYALGSAADRLFVTRTGGTGSIGVWTAHVDMSKMLEMEGIKVTYIFAGKRKVDGNPCEPLSDRAQADMQADVDRIRDMFVQTVARNRAVSADALYATEAGCYMAEAGVPLLADSVGSFDDALTYLRGRIGSQSTTDPALLDLPADADDDDGDLVAVNFASVHAAGRGFAERTLGRDDAGRKIILAVRRSAGTMLNLASAEAGSAKVARVNGIVAPYNSVSGDLGGFQEVYQAGCFDKWLATDDPRVLAFHNPEHVLGRKSANTARFWSDAAGLHYEADLPDTQVARDLRVSMERKDVRESSAAFYITDYAWENRSGVRTRVIKEARLVEASPYSFPAYTESTAQSEEVPQATAVDHELEHLGARLRLLRSA